MEFKIKHKMTFDCPDFLATEINRSNRKTKTMLRSFRGGNKQPNPFQYTSSNFNNLNNQNQRNIKTLVEYKIEQLHDKMKEYFNNERKNSKQKIGKQIQELKQKIKQLRQELKKPKSNEEVEEQKHEILKKKIILLRQIERINKQLKENKCVFSQLKFQSQELNNTINNLNKTILKYNERNQLIMKNSKNCDQNNVIKQKTQNNNLNHIVNGQNSLNTNNVQIQTPFNQLNSHNVNKQQITSNNGPINSIISTNQHQQDKQLIHQRQTNNIHITQINVQNNLSSIQNQENKTKSKNCNQLTNNKLVQNTKQLNQLTNKSHLNQISKHRYKNSNTSFDQYLRYNTIQTSLNTKQNINHNYFQMQGNIKNNNKKYKDKMDLKQQINNYKKIINKQKWNQIQFLFNQLQASNTKQYILPIKSSQSKLQNNKPKEINKISNNKSFISELEQLLMQELRKQQFQKFKQKGYHNGLKDKTHQIKIQVNKIFKNYHPIKNNPSHQTNKSKYVETNNKTTDNVQINDENSLNTLNQHNGTNAINNKYKSHRLYNGDQFFQSVINKKPIKKILTKILQNSYQ